MSASADPPPKPWGELRVSLLGTFQVSADGQVVPGDAWPLRKARSLCKLLALSPGRRLEREQIMGQLWPDLAPQAAGNNLRYALYIARRALPPQAIVSAGSTLALRPVGPIWVDVDAFETAARGALGTRDPASYSAALDHYQGELLPEDRYEDWTIARREALRDLHLQLLLELAALHERSGAWATAIATLQRVLAEDATHEDTHTALMRLYALAGQRALALRQWDVLTTTLRHELNASPGAVSRAFRDEIATGRFPPSPPLDATAKPRRTKLRDNLPVPLSSLVGREAAQIAVKEALVAARLVTLIGAGGVGKTRLALAVATDLVGAHPDGVWLIDLTALTDPALIPGSIANALNVRELSGGASQDQVVAALRERDLILVLDNCEHLVAACAILADALLQNCPRLRILATSREALGIPGEVVWRVPSLPFPPSIPKRPTATPAMTDLMSLARVPAVRLFVDRARQRRADFALTSDNAPAIVELCRRLEGIPLALELAAARIGVLTAAQLADRLDDSLGTLIARHRTGPSRQQTLRATLDWSHALLMGAEKRLFSRLAVFAGGWTLEAAEAIWDVAPKSAFPPSDSGVGVATVAPATALDLLEGLVEKSLVIVEQQGTASRYRMLEVVRQYAATYLNHAPDEGAIRHAHVTYYLALAEQTRPLLTGSALSIGLSTLEMEHDNLRAAIGWSLAASARTQTPPLLPLRLGNALTRFWTRQGYLDEGHRWWTAILDTAAPHEAAIPRPILAHALTNIGVVNLFRGDASAARVALTRSIALWHDAGDLHGAARAMISLGFVESGAGATAEALRLLEQSATIFRTLGDQQNLVAVLDNIGFVAMLGGDYARSRRALEESIALSRAADLPDLITSLNNLGNTLLETGDTPAALAAQHEALGMARTVGVTVPLLWALEGVAHALGTIPARTLDAARLYGAAEALRDAIGYRRFPAALAYHERRTALVRTQADPAAFTAAWVAGRAVPLEATIDDALALSAALCAATDNEATGQ